MKPKLTSKFILVGCFVAVAFATTLADTKTWTGAVSVDWHTGSNWNPVGEPLCATDDVYVNNGGKPEIHFYKAVAHSLTLGSSAGDSGKVLVDGTQNGISHGSLEVCDGSAVYIGNQGNGTLTINNGANITSGTVFIAASDGSHGEVTVTDTASNWYITTGDLAQILIGLNASGQNGGIGLLNVNTGGRVQVDNFSSLAPAVSVGPSGTLMGDGTVEMRSGSSTQMQVRGTLAPSGVTLTIGGDLSFVIAAPGDAPTMECTVALGDVTTTPKVAVSGTASLTGKLSVTMAGTTFTPGTRYTLFRADGGRINTFSTYSIKFSPNEQCFTPVITYDANNVYLYLQPCS